MIENEYKWLMRRVDIQLRNKLIYDYGATYCAIRQGTLAANEICWTRVRETTDLLRNSVQLTMTTKVKCDELIEIESEIDSYLGSILLNTKAKDVIFKYRVEWMVDDVKWAFDLYKTLYMFIPILEAEVPRGEERPIVPDYLREYVGYEVEQTDGRFSSAKFANQKEIYDLYLSLVERT